MTISDFYFGLVVFFFLADVCLLLGIGVLTRALPTMRKLTAAQKLLAHASLDKPLGPNTPLVVMTNRMLYDLLSVENHVGKLQEFISFKFGALIAILHQDEKSFRRIVRELQYYAWAFALLFIAGFVYRLGEMGNSISFHAIRDDIGTHPLHVMDAVALTALIVLGFRLVSEISRIRDLLDP
jgi:hypothetical protein